MGHGRILEIDPMGFAGGLDAQNRERESSRMTQPLRVSLHLTYNVVCLLAEQYS